MNNSVYDSKFYDTISSGSLQSARETVPLVLSLIRPQSVIDVGCGIGTWLSIFREHGIIDIIGLDGEYVDTNKLLIPSDRFIAFDLMNNISLGRTFDLALSLEVAEHLPQECAEQFVGGLVSLSKVILFSAAIPGQTGENHVNEQWPEYWKKLFALHGYEPVDCLRARLWNNEQIEPWYRQNTIFYVEKGYLQNVIVLLKEKAKYEGCMFSVVHPDMYTIISNQSLTSTLTFRDMLKMLPVALLKAIKYRIFRRL